MGANSIGEGTDADDIVCTRRVSPGPVCAEVESVCGPSGDRWSCPRGPCAHLGPPGGTVAARRPCAGAEGDRLQAQDGLGPDAGKDRGHLGLPGLPPAQLFGGPAAGGGQIAPLCRGPGYKGGICIWRESPGLCLHRWRWSAHPGGGQVGDPGGGRAGNVSRRPHQPRRPAPEGAGSGRGGGLPGCSTLHRPAGRCHRVCPQLAHRPRLCPSPGRSRGGGGGDLCLEVQGRSQCPRLRHRGRFVLSQKRM